MKEESYLLKEGQNYACSLCKKVWHNPTPFTLAKHFEEVHDYKIEIASLDPLQIEATPPKREVGS